MYYGYSGKPTFTEVIFISDYFNITKVLPMWLILTLTLSPYPKPSSTLPNPNSMQGMRNPTFNSSQAGLLALLALDLANLIHASD